MNKILSTALFLVGFALAAILIIGISVYGFNDYDKMKGQGISFQIGFWVITFYSAIVGSAFAVGTALFDPKFKKGISFLFGALLAVVVLGVTWVPKAASARVQTSILAVLLFCGSFLLPPMLNYFFQSDHNRNTK